MRALLLFIVTVSLTACAQRIDDIDQRVEIVNQRVAELETKTGRKGPSDREILDGQRLVDFRSQIAGLRNDLTVMSGKVEALEYENKNLTARMDQLAQEVQLKSAELDKMRAPSTDPSDPEAAYQTALRLHQDGDFVASEKAFEAFIKAHPKHRLVANAMYWAGEGYMTQKSYRKAITRFQDMIERFPKADKRCDAISRQIEALDALGMKKEAQAFLQVKNAECSKR